MPFKDPGSELTKQHFQLSIDCIEIELLTLWQVYGVPWIIKMRTGLEIWVLEYCCLYTFTHYVCEKNALRKESYKNVQAYYTLARFYRTANKRVARLQENQKARDQRGKMKQPSGSEEENTSKMSMTTIRNVWDDAEKAPTWHSMTVNGLPQWHNRQWLWWDYAESKTGQYTAEKVTSLLRYLIQKWEEKWAYRQGGRQGAKENILMGRTTARCVAVRVFVYTKERRGCSGVRASETESGPQHGGQRLLLEWAWPLNDIGRTN